MSPAEEYMRKHDDASRLYYEAHISLEPLDDSQIKVIDKMCVAMGWKRATFVMNKNNVPNGFITARHTSFKNIRRMVVVMVDELKKMPDVKLLRYKIEDTLLDSNHGDEL